jgi:3-hydroxyisobutyrate dehydrogenase-like beta-hydroxyacid dehydrogenase
MSMKVSFIGLGNMGTPIAFNLLKHGVELYVYNRTQEKTTPLVKAGAKLLKTPRDAFKEASILFSMVANDHALSAITEGAEGILEEARPGCIHVSLSTVAPATTKKLALKHQEKGTHFLASPVFGRPDAAAQQALWVCVAGDDDAKKQVEPLLQMIGKKTYDFGSNPEVANAVKLAGNFMILSIIEMLSEVFTFAEKSGVKSEKLHAFLTETLFPSPVFLNYGKLILEQKFIPAGFKMSLGLKDLDLFLRTAETLQTPSPIGGVLHTRLLASLAKGREEDDWSAISLISREDAGL